MSGDVVQLFRRLTSGVYVVGVADGAARDAFTAAWVMQVSFDPLLIALSVNTSNASYPLLVAGGGFSINVLGHGQLDHARRFGTVSGREVDKFADVSWEPAPSTGSPLLIDAVAYLDCQLVERHLLGDHELIVGRVLDGAVRWPGVLPMAYAETGDLDQSSGLYPATLG
jgi:flavin reductase (DIM6/NTAB) family NADH-FMN oxidoreductase RutF